MGFRQWEKEFDRHVKKGEKGIKIFAPAPYKVKKLVDKIDPETRKPMLDSEGKVVKEEKEITVPAFKVIDVYKRQDPMSSYIGENCSMNNANETRAEFNHLIAVAKNTGLSLIHI